MMPKSGKGPQGLQFPGAGTRLIPRIAQSIILITSMMECSVPNVPLPNERERFIQLLCRVNKKADKNNMNESYFRCDTIKAFSKPCVFFHYVFAHFMQYGFKSGK
jgi:hypothetical protein